MTPRTPRKPLVITIDGPAGSGKSTVARRLASALGLRFLDTGAMYRGLTAYCLDHDIQPATQPQEVIRTARDAAMRFDWTTDPPRFLIDGKDFTSRLRDHDVTTAVSDVAVLGPVRQVMVEAQRRIAAESSPPDTTGQATPKQKLQANDIYGIVSEGRDQGSVVFPDADAKFYLRADPAVRAQRRADELRRAGRDADDDQILAEIQHRDHRDRTRSDGPLVEPEGAQVVDTSHRTIQQVVDALEDRVRATLPSRLPTSPDAVLQSTPSDPRQPEAGRNAK